MENEHFPEHLARPLETVKRLATLVFTQTHEDSPNTGAAPMLDSQLYDRAEE